LDPSPLICKEMGSEGGKVVEGNASFPRFGLLDHGVYGDAAGLRCAVLVDELEQQGYSRVAVVHLERQHESASEVGVAD
ncbi:hypothetical protein PMAYCL1PPCAC_19951, partial [Pristionchus mayeri]